MGRPPQCGCCNLLPCSEDNNLCWNNFFEDIGTLSYYMGDDILESHDLVLFARLTYRDGLKVYHGDGDYLSMISPNPIDPTRVYLKEGSSFHEIVNIPPEDKNGTSFILLTTNKSSGVRILEHMRNCEENIDPIEIIEFSKPVFHNWSIFYTDPGRYDITLINKIFVFSEERQEIVVSVDSPMSMLDGTVGKKISDGRCSSICFGNQDFWDREELYKIHGLKEPLFNSRYCGLNEDGKPYSQYRADFGQLNIEYDNSPWYSETNSIGYTGNMLNIEIPLFESMSLTFNGTFEGSYPLTIKDENEFTCGNVDLKAGDLFIETIPVSMTVSAQRLYNRFFSSPLSGYAGYTIFNESATLEGFVRIDPQFVVLGVSAIEVYLKIVDYQFDYTPPPPGQEYSFFNYGGGYLNNIRPLPSGNPQRKYLVYKSINTISNSAPLGFYSTVVLTGSNEYVETLSDQEFEYLRDTPLHYESSLRYDEGCPLIPGGFLEKLIQYTSVNKDGTETVFNTTTNRTMHYSLKLTEIVNYKNGPENPYM